MPQTKTIQYPPRGWPETSGTQKPGKAIARHLPKSHLRLTGCGQGAVKPSLQQWNQICVVGALEAAYGRCVLSNRVADKPADWR